ncbi:MAG TPA: YggS family pyridoxal phosphate-dependent enzyme [Candidatus Micrarchaeia archaeon]|nr:YggS family pyridoxal phosphate-dependent enzyme [Candidatus Micrarchaeia archaeon]
MPVHVPAGPAPDPAGLTRRLRSVREAIDRATAAAGRPAGSVELLPVTKGQPARVAAACRSAGLSRLGENYVQECRAKAEQLAADGPPLHWHLLGHCQRNKARQAAALFHEVETVDSVHLARLLGEARPAGDPIPVLCEVELTGLPGRTGFSPETLRRHLAELLAVPGLAVRGLMTVAAPADPGAFTRCRLLRDELAAGTGAPLPVLSMGMSDDFEAAIAAGSTRVRIGRALFGPRPSG